MHMSVSVFVWHECTSPPPYMRNFRQCLALLWRSNVCMHELIKNTNTYIWRNHIIKCNRQKMHSHMHCVLIPVETWLELEAVLRSDFGEIRFLFFFFKSKFGYILDKLMEIWAVLLLQIVVDVWAVSNINIFTTLFTILHSQKSICCWHRHW